MAGGDRCDPSPPSGGVNACCPAKGVRAPQQTLATILLGRDGRSSLCFRAGLLDQRVLALIRVFGDQLLQALQC